MPEVWNYLGALVFSFLKTGGQYPCEEFRPGSGCRTVHCKSRKV